MRPASSIAGVDRGTSAGVRWASGATECWGWVDWTLDKFGVGQGFGGLPDFEVVDKINECTMCADGRGARHGL